MTEDEIIGWDQGLNGHEFEQTPEIVKDREVWCAAVHGISKREFGKRLGEHQFSSVQSLSRV